jgi:hypothetical protein
MAPNFLEQDHVLWSSPGHVSATPSRIRLSRMGNSEIHFDGTWKFMSNDNMAFAAICCTAY